MGDRYNSHVPSTITYKAGGKMNFVLCSNFDNADEILQYAMEYFEKCHYYPKVEIYREKQDFLMETENNDIILIAWAKARGMEIVRQAADRNKNAKIIWISRDEGTGTLSPFQ